MLSIEEDSDRQDSEIDLSEDENIQYVLRGKDSTSTDGEDSESDLGHSVGYSTPFEYSSEDDDDLISIHGIKKKRVVLPIDEDKAYKAEDSGIGNSTGSYSALLEKTTRHKARTGSETCDIDCDRYMDGININDRSISLLLRQRPAKPFRYPKLEKDLRKLQGLCQTGKYKQCKIDIIGSHEAVCKVIDENDRTPNIKISGRSRCGMHFSGDEVVVRILKQGGEFIPRLQRQVTDDTDWYGEVAGFIQRNRYKNVNHPVMLCVLDHIESRNNMVRPICKTVPKIYVRHRKDTSTDEIELYEHNEETQLLTFSRTEKINLTRRQDVIFVVAYVAWRHEMYPIGVVLNIIKRGQSVEQEISILRYEKQIKQDFTAGALEAAKSLVSERGNVYSSLQSDGYKEEPRQNIFTISNLSKRKSTAYSFQTLSDSHTEIGVYVVDVASIIKKGSYMDNEAMLRGGSLHEHICERTMLPPVIERSFSFAQDIIVPAISVFFKVDRSYNVVQKSLSIAKLLVRCSNHFSYETIQNLIDNDGAKCQFCTEKETCHIRHIYEVAKQLRTRRLGCASLAQSLTLDLTNEEGNFIKQAWYAECIEEELTIFVNNFFARQLWQTNCHFLILRQDQPSEEKVLEWKKSYGHFCRFVVALQDCRLKETLSINDTSLDNLRYSWIIGLQANVWRNIKEFIRQGQLQELQRLVCTDDLHPMVALSKENWKSFQSNEEYKVLISPRRNFPDKSESNFSLRCALYLQATDPFARYADLVNQRLIHSLFRPDIHDHQTDLNAVCSITNQWKRKVELFEKDCNKAILASRISSVPLFLKGFVDEVNKTHISVFVPGFDSVGDGKVLTIDLSHLLPYGDTELGKDPISERPFIRVKWQKRIYSVDRFSRPPQSNYTEKRINPHQKAHFLQLNEWRRLLKKIIDNEEQFREFTDERESILDMAPESRKTVHDVSCEVPGERVVNQLCWFQTTFNIGQIISFQISSNYEMGKLQIKPQVLDLTKNIKFCLDHVSDPVGAFEMHYANHYKQEYSSLKEYGELWSSLLLMDAACNAINEDAITINDIDVEFSDDGGSFELDKKFCEIRDIDLFNIPLDFFPTPKSDEVYTTSRADYICIKCLLSDFEPEHADDYADDMQYLILHGKLCDASAEIMTEGKTITVNFLLNMNSRNLHSLTGQSKRCSIEILPKGDRVR